MKEYRDTETGALIIKQSADEKEFVERMILMKKIENNYENIKNEINLLKERIKILEEKGK